MVALYVLLIHSDLVAFGEGKCDPPCAKAGTISTGTVCQTVEYTLSMTPAKTPLPPVHEFARILKQRINSTATVGCAGWDITTNRIICKVTDLKGAVNSSTNQIESMRRQMERNELEVGANYPMQSFDYHFQIKVLPKAQQAEAWAVAVTVTIFLLVLGPYCCFAQFWDEKYRVTSKRDESTRAMRLKKDKEERLKKMKAKKNDFAAL